MAILLLLLGSGAALSATTALESAEQLYQRTEYRTALEQAQRIAPRDAATWSLIGRCRYYLGDAKAAVEAFEKAAQMEPNSARHEMWLGRAWGRRAESAVFFMAIKYAAKTREHLERAVTLDARSKEASGDLLDFYLGAPSMVGGGIDRAQALAERIGQHDQAEKQWALAQIAQKNKQWNEAEQHLRKALELEPHSVNRMLDLARLLAKQGRAKDSDAMFNQAAAINAKDKRLLYARAESYIQTGRNFDEARRLLNEYLQSALTPDDPSREEARKLLQRASGRG